MKKNSAAAVLKDDEKWRVESDLRTMIEAEAIKNDVKRFAKVQALAKERIAEVAKVASKED